MNETLAIYQLAQIIQRVCEMMMEVTDLPSPRIPFTRLSYLAPKRLTTFVNSVSDVEE